MMRTVQAALLCAAIAGCAHPEISRLKGIPVLIGPKDRIGEAKAPPQTRALGSLKLSTPEEWDARLHAASELPSRCTDGGRVYGQERWWDLRVTRIETGSAFLFFCCVPMPPLILPVVEADYKVTVEGDLVERQQP